MDISFHSAPRAANVVSSFVIFLAGLHSELTTQRQVTPKRIKEENKAAHPTAGTLLLGFRASFPPPNGLYRSVTLRLDFHVEDF